MDEKIKRALKLTRENFECFSRNGRWGTCAACPRDSQNNPYPEFCINTKRGDHLLDIQQLCDNYNVNLHK